MFLVGALALAVFSFIAASAKKKGISLIFGVASMLLFITWLSSGPGFSFLDFVEDPQVNVPDNIPLPGGQ